MADKKKLDLQGEEEVSSRSAAGNNAQQYSYKPYQQSDSVKRAQEMLEQQMAQKPGQYQPTWQNQLNDIMDQIMNREKFSYNLNGDAFYQQYKDQAARNGKLAMMDTMGQAAALTGGYGNSYAQTAGQQVYNGYMQQLNDKATDLYRLALEKYNQEGQDLYSKFSMLGAMDDQDYGRYRDAMADWSSAVDRAQSRYDTERDYDYGMWADDRNFGYSQYVDDRNYQYQLGRDQNADAQWQAEFDEALRRWNFENKQGEFALLGGTGSGGNGLSGNEWLNKDGTVNLDYIRKNSDWWKAYAAKHGLDPDTGLYLGDGEPGDGPKDPEDTEVTENNNSDTGINPLVKSQANDAILAAKQIEQEIQKMLDSGEMTRIEAKKARLQYLGNERGFVK